MIMGITLVREFLSLFYVAFRIISRRVGPILSRMDDCNAISYYVGLWVL